MTHTHCDVRRAGYTVLEIVIALALMGVVVLNIHGLLAQSSSAVAQQTIDSDADVQARRALERIAMAIMSAHEETLYVTSQSPGSQPHINYVESLGVADDDGDGVSEPVTSDPMRIELVESAQREITWFENPGLPEQKRVVWSKGVREYNLGEIANGVDDNGNGLIDEKGLSFVKQGKTVRILLTVSRSDGHGGFVERMHETIVTCRN